MSILLQISEKYAKSNIIASVGLEKVSVIGAGSFLYQKNVKIRERISTQGLSMIGTGIKNLKNLTYLSLNFEYFINII